MILGANVRLLCLPGKSNLLAYGVTLLSIDFIYLFLALQDLLS